MTKRSMLEDLKRLDSGRMESAACAAVSFLCIWFVCVQAMMLLNPAHPLLDTLVDRALWYGVSVCGWLAALCAVLVLCKNRTAAPRRGFRAWFSARPWDAFFYAMLIWAAITCFFAVNPLHAWFGNDYRHEGWYTYALYAAIFACVCCIREEGRRKGFLTVFLICGLALCAPCMGVSAIQALGGDVSTRYAQLKVSSVFSNTNHFGYFLCVFTACGAGEYLLEKAGWRRALGLVCTAAGAFALLVNNTLGAQLGALGAIIAATALTMLREGRVRWQDFVPLALCLAIAAAFNYKTPSVSQNAAALVQDVQKVIVQSEDAGKAGSGRWKLWRIAWEQLWRHPLFGVGIEGMEAVYAQAGATVERPHNEYLQHAVFMGIPALLMYLAALGSIAARKLHALKDLPAAQVIAGCAVLGYCISAFVGNTMYYTTPFFFMLLGLLCSSDRSAV